MNKSNEIARIIEAELAKMGMRLTEGRGWYVVILVEGVGLVKVWATAELVFEPPLAIEGARPGWRWTDQPIRENAAVCRTSSRDSPAVAGSMPARGAVSKSSGQPPARKDQTMKTTNQVAKHKLVNRGPESWLAPTGESVRVQDASDYDLAMAFEAPRVTAEDEDVPVLEPVSALAGAIAVEIVANRRHFFRSAARPWAAEVARQVRGILGMPRAFTDWLICETGAHGETIVTVIEEEEAVHAVAAYVRGGYASDREITVHRAGAPGAPTRYRVGLASGAAYLDSESYPPRGRCDEADVYGRSPEDAARTWAVGVAYTNGEPNAAFEMLQGRAVTVDSGLAAPTTVTVQLPR